MNLFYPVSPDGGVLPLEHELPKRFGRAGHAEEVRGVQVPEDLRNHRIHLSLDFGSRKRSKGHTSRETIGVIQGSASKRASCRIPLHSFVGESAVVGVAWLEGVVRSLSGLH